MSAKITYVNGSYLTPAALNGYFGISAATGHVHDGGSDATCAPKIDVTACLSGIVPSVNLYTAVSSFSCGMQAIGGGAVVTVTFYYIRLSEGIVKIWWENITGLQSDTVHRSTTTILTTHSLTPAVERRVYMPIAAFGVDNFGNFVAQDTGYLILAAGSPATAYISQVVEYKL